MATKGSFNTGSYTSDGITRYLTFSWERTSYSVEDNTSTIAWELKGGGSSGWMMCGGFKVVIDGETVYTKSTDYRIKVYNTTVVASGTKTIKHNIDGSRSFSASAQAGIWTYAVNKSGSGSWDLDDIPRKATLTAAPNFNDEDNPVITYSNLAGNGVSSLEACISLTGAADDIEYRAISKTGSSYTFNLTDAERNVLRKATVDSNSRSIRFYVRTVIGDTTYMHYLTKTFSIVNGAPTLSPTATDTGSVSTKLTGNANTIIKGYNSVSVATGAAARKAATLESYKITCGGKSITTTSGKLNNVESGSFTFRATDSRGNTTTKTLTKTLINYTKLTCNLAANAPTTAGNMNFTVKGNYFNGSFGAVDNTLTVQYRYKVNDGAYGAWTALNATISGNTYTATASLSGLDYLSSYTFQARALDAIYNDSTEDAIYSATKKVKTTPVFDWGEDDFKFNVDVNMEQFATFRNGGVGIRGTTTDGEAITAFQPCNTNNNLAIGYGGYDNKIGATHVYGDTVRLISNQSVLVNGAAIAENKVLWSGEYYMSGGQSATLTEPISAQAAGVVLVFSRYDIANSEALNEHFNYHFVPKQMIALQAGKGSIFNMNTSNETFAASKYLYIYDKYIDGHANNTATGTGNTGITYNNNRFVLRYVIGV